MTTQLLSPEATTAFNRAMNPVIKTNMYGHEITSTALHVTPEGVLQTPLRVFEDGYVTTQSGTERHQRTEPKGYKTTDLHLSDGSWYPLGIHRLVLFSFKQQWSCKENQTVVHHLDGNKGNNNISNLQLDDNRNNVMRFWSGQENTDYIDNKQYQSERIAKGRVPMMHKGKLVSGYEIDRKGHVYHTDNVTGEVHEVKASIANKNYPTNKNIKFKGTTASLHGLVAENFTVVPDGYYKTLLIDKALAELYTPENIYVVPRKF